MLEIAKQSSVALTEQIMVRVTVAMLDDIEKFSRKHDIKNSEFIRSVLDAYFKQFDNETQRKTR